MVLVEVGISVLRAVVPSLGKLLMNGWGLDKAVKTGLRNLEGELMSMHAFLEDVSGMPPDHLESQVKIRVREVKELSHVIETRLRTFMENIESAKAKGILLSAPIKLFINRQMENYIKEALIEVKRLRRHGTYPSKSALESTSARKGGTRMFAMDNRESNPVGLHDAIADLTKKLSKGDHVSIVGMGGMGKTTLARAVYNKMEGDFKGDSDCRAFVHIGQSADMKKILTKIFDGLHIQMDGHEPDQLQLTNQLQDFLANKRCLIVIDDVWDEGTWSLVEGVFKGSARIKMITTTRNLKVAEEVGGVYQIEPLSPSDSKELLRAKAGAKILDTEFDTVLDRILRKCGGVPMAITIIGSLLAKSESKQWHREYDSIGFDERKENGAFEHIRKVLSYSYYVLPYVLQKCFLYLSMFPEDHWIERNMLIWKWVAEGLVPDGLFETGEKCFIELLDRSMIQWAVSPRDIGQGGCRLHGLMLDLIRDLSSSEVENFSTVLGMKKESTSQTRPIHRLAIHEGQYQNTSLEVGKVLSFYASKCAGGSFPALEKFKQMRVIDLESCDLSAGDCKLEHLGKVDRLGYIGLVGTPVAELPKKIGHLKLLQTLDVRATGISELSSFVEDLRNLRCLRAGKGTRMMGRVGKLTSLEELWLHSADKSSDFAKDLRKLTKMRVLVIHFDEMDGGMQEALVESLRDLVSLQVLQVWSHAEEKVRLGSWEGSVPSPQLRQLLLFGIILPRPMPWIHKLRVPKLSKLLLQVEVLEAAHLEILGQMPSLRSLYLHSQDNSLSYIAEEDEFPELGYINTNIELICGKGGLPKMQELEVGGIKVRNGTDVGLQENMPLLETATYHLDCKDSGIVQVDEAEKKLRQATEGRHLALFIKRWNNKAYNFEKYYTPKIGWAGRALVEKGASCDMAGRALVEKGASCDIVNNIISSFLARTMQDIGVPHTLAVVDLDPAESTGSPSQEKSCKRCKHDAVLRALNNYRDGTEADLHPNIGEMLMQNPEFIALVESGSWPPNDYRLAEIMLPIIASCMAKETDGSGNDQGTLAEVMLPVIIETCVAEEMDRSRNDQDTHGNLAESSSARASRNEPPPDELETNPTLEGDRLIEMLATFALLKDPVRFQRILKKCRLSTLRDVSPEMISAYFLDDNSKLVWLVRIRLLEQAIWNYFTEGDMEGPSSRRPPKLDDVVFMLYVLNKPSVANFMSAVVAENGAVDPVAIERKFMKCLLNPKIIAALKVQSDDRSETRRLLMQLFKQELDNYLPEQDIDGPSSTSGYGGDGGQTDASSTSASSEQADAQVNADRRLIHGERADASDMLPGLSREPALDAQSDTMNAVASSAASLPARAVLRLRAMDNLAVLAVLPVLAVLLPRALDNLAVLAVLLAIAVLLLLFSRIMSALKKVATRKWP